MTYTNIPFLLPLGHYLGCYRILYPGLQFSDPQFEVGRQVLPRWGRGKWWLLGGFAVALEPSSDQVSLLLPNPERFGYPLWDGQDKVW